jgi:hypothetical protein
MGKNIFKFDNSVKSGWFLYDRINAREKVRKICLTGMTIQNIKTAFLSSYLCLVVEIEVRNIQLFTDANIIYRNV